MAEQAKQAQDSNPHEDAARLRKRDRIVAQVVLQARMNSKVTWAQWADFLATASAHFAESFILSCGEQVSDTTMSKTWPLVVAVVRSWAESDARVLAFETRR